MGPDGLLAAAEHCSRACPSKPELHCFSPDNGCERRIARERILRGAPWKIVFTRNFHERHAFDETGQCRVSRRILKELRADDRSHQVGESGVHSKTVRRFERTQLIVLAATRITQYPDLHVSYSRGAADWHWQSSFHAFAARDCRMTTHSRGTRRSVTRGHPSYGPNTLVEADDGKETMSSRFPLHVS